MSTITTGLSGEELACKFLIKQGYKILERNYRIRGGEIDIVCKDGEYLVFVEVKTRYSHEYGLPSQSITPWKIKALLKTAAFYVQKIGWGNGPYRLDLVGIDYAEDKQSLPGKPGKDNPRIELIKDITAF